MGFYEVWGKAIFLKQERKKKDAQTKKNDGLLFWALFKLGSCRLMTEMGGGIEW